MWKTVETKAEKIGIAKTKGRQGEERSRKETGREGREKEKTIEVKRVAEEWETWDDDEEAVKSEVEAKKLVPEKFHRWIKVFGKKQLERIPAQKIWDYAIDMKEGFVLKKRTVYLLLKEEREEVREFI